MILRPLGLRLGADILLSAKCIAFIAAFAVGYCLAAAGAAEPATSDASQSPAGLALFRSHVRELFTDHCVKCHGGEKTNGEFDLTTREALLKGGSQGPAIISGKSAQSLLYRLITHADEPNMPDKAPKLPDEAIAKIAAWIDAGAPYDKSLQSDSGPAVAKPIPAERRQFWSLRPLLHAPIPAVKNEAWCGGPLDRFVLAQLEARGIQPNGPAERRRLIRRASFDLIGLPPTVEQVDAFVNDSGPDAYERLIDGLLASPHYGERWGRHWLDLARFAESHGYEQDYDRASAYHYRDFVIRALNEDMPYDQFVRWQIAGDELAADQPQAWMATGFLAAGTHATQITANQAEKERYDELDDMAATIGTAMLGLTIGCARCHDHKFDPISQHDYYRMLANFTTTVRSDYDFDLQPEANRKAKEEFAVRHAPHVAALRQFESAELPGRFAAWLGSQPQSVTPDWLILDLASQRSSSGSRFARREDGSYVASDNVAKFDIFTLTARGPLPSLTAIRLEALTDPSLPKGGPGRDADGNFALTGFRVMARPPGGEVTELHLRNARATFEQAKLPAAAAIDNDSKSGWGVAPQIGKNQAIAFEPEEIPAFEAGTEYTFTLMFENSDQHAIGRLRLSISTSFDAPPLDGSSWPLARLDELRSVQATDPKKWTAKQRATALAWYQSRDPDWQRLHEAVEDHRLNEPKPVLTKALICSEGVPAVRLHTQGPDFYDQTFFLKRGDLAQKQTPASAGFLRVLENGSGDEGHWQSPPPAGARTSHRRAALARWLSDADQGAGHLLARVIVNRLWQHHFGRGIVATPSDFGGQGERPTHPELLDWLASELIRGGWRLKPLHKLMLTSATYLEAPDTDLQRARSDPDNKLLWHYPRRRLEAESLRDAMLAVSGLLDESMFGPGTLDENQRRRTIYFTIKRSKLIPWMVNFDCPEPLQGVGQRSTTTVAPQALALMNNSTVFDAARKCAKALAERGGSTAEHVQRAYLVTLARPPEPAELEDSIEFIEHQAASYRAAEQKDAAGRALADFCQVLLSLNEFAYVD